MRPVLSRLVAGCQRRTTSVGKDIWQNTAVTWNSYVAVGDSFTEGIGDTPTHDGLRHRGWADRLAQALHQEAASTGGTQFGYANFAIRGRTLPPIINDQLPQALSLSPDLVSITGGINDAMRPRFDLDRTANLLESGVVAARETGADVLLVGFGEPSRRSRPFSLIADRLRDYRGQILRIADTHDCYLLDPWHETQFDDPRFWAPDRLHLNALGHERIAYAAMESLGLAAPDWHEPLPDAPRPSLMTDIRSTADWSVRYLAPWIARRILRRSSGDGLAAKRPTLMPVHPD